MTMPSRPPLGDSRIFRFGAFELDASRRCLMRAGARVALMPKPMSLLILLLQRPGQLVAKEEVVRELWGDDPVTDASVFQVAGFLRKTLGAVPGGGDYLDRHARGGYRMVVPVAVIEACVPPADPDDTLSSHLAFVQGWVALESFERTAVERARQDFAAVLSRHPDHGSAHIGMANALVLTHESIRADGLPDADNLLAGAEHHARRGCALLPASANSWSTLAVVKHRRSQTLDAVAAMRQALSIDAKDWRLHLRLAWVSWGEERLAAARRVLAAMPGQPLAHWFAATVYVARGLLDSALEELRAGCAAQDLQLTPGASQTLRFTAAGLHWLHGLVLYARGDHDGAVVELSREIAFEGRGQLFSREATANSWYGLGVVHHQAGRLDESGAAFAQARTRVARHPMTMLYVAPASLLSSVPGGAGGVLESVEASMVMAAWLVMSHQHGEAARLCAEALHRAPYGPAGWLMPVEPTLRTAVHGDVWAQALATLRARAM